MTTPTAPRRHRIAAFATRNARMHGLLATVVPDFPALLAIADQARELSCAARHSMPGPVSWPTSHDELNDAWIEHEVARRRAITDFESRTAIFADLEYNAVSDAYALIEDHTDELITALAGQFDDLLDRLSTAVSELGPDVDTATAAINSGTAATNAWRHITAMTTEYADIRHVQSRIYHDCDTVNYDELRCGEGQPNVTDPEARVYFHEHLDDVAPHWRGTKRADGNIGPGEYPWPADPVERLVWFVRSDSGMWCPTPAQLASHLTGGSNNVNPRSADAIRITEQARPLLNAISPMPVP